jgi:hypothetical protein
MRRIYITGDTHRDFRRVAALCDTVESTMDDILIILGDAGINYFGGEKDAELKCRLAELPITLLCIHGNHEQRPESILHIRRPIGTAERSMLKRITRHSCSQKTERFTISTGQNALSSAVRTAWTSHAGLPKISDGGRTSNRRRR